MLVVSSDIEATLKSAGLCFGFEDFRVRDDWDICFVRRLLFVVGAGTNYFFEESDCCEALIGFDLSGYCW